MMTTRKLNRRSFMARVAGLAAGGATALVSGTAHAQRTRNTYTGTTDCDSGNSADSPGYGTGTSNRYTDRDTGPQGDPRCQGRGPARNEGTPSGTGHYGGIASGCSDSDTGPGGDPGGRGVRCNGQTPPTYRPPGVTRHCSDSDSGRGADPLQRGVRC